MLQWNLIGPLSPKEKRCNVTNFVARSFSLCKAKGPGCKRRGCRLLLVVSFTVELWLLVNNFNLRRSLQMAFYFICNDEDLLEKTNEIF